MHCFIGIDVKQPLAREVIGLQNQWQKLDLPPADFHKHTDPHITLVPPFECSDVVDMAGDLEEVAKAFPQFSLSFARVGAFNRRILHVSLDSNAIVELRSRLLVACAGYSQIHDSNPFFHPHTTIGYTRQPMTSREQTITTENLEDSLHLPQRQEVNEFLLYGREKPATNYRVLARLRLNTHPSIEN